MAQIIWFNQPTNHSGTVNLLFLNPDGEVGDFSMYLADGGGPYILGGPALSWNYMEFTDAALTLISLLPAGFHFFPQSSEEAIREVVEQYKAEVIDKSPRLFLDELHLWAYSKAYRPSQWCEMLLADSPPQSPVVFVDWEQYGPFFLGVELTHLYYGLPKERREELGLKQDWEHDLD